MPAKDEECPELGKKSIPMYNAGMKKKAHKRICDICGTTGQFSFFKGVSRFLLSTEECEECVGTGFQLGSAGDGKAHSKEENKIVKNTKKRKK